MRLELILHGPCGLRWGLVGYLGVWHISELVEPEAQAFRSMSMDIVADSKNQPFPCDS